MPKLKMIFVCCHLQKEIRLAFKMTYANLSSYLNAETEELIIAVLRAVGDCRTLPG